MPNSFAYFALFSWPLVVAVFFRFMPRSYAIASSIIGGYLLLPDRTGFDLPALPSLDKTLLPSLAAGLLCIFWRDDKTRRRGPPEPVSANAGKAEMSGRGPDAPPMNGLQVSHGSSRANVFVLRLLVIVLIGSPFFTAIVNSEPIWMGPRYLPAIRIYDAFSMILTAFVSILPFLLGWRYLGRQEDHQALLFVLATTGVAYTFPALFEIRISPQLNAWIYGFFPHSFIQHIRAGGFRPLVFLPHGLWLGIYLAMAIVACAALYRLKRRASQPATRWLLLGAWVFGALVLAKSLGALIIAGLLVVVTLFLGRRLAMLIALVVALTVLTYPMLRGAGWVPVQTALDISASIDEERAASLNYRFENEDVLLQRANEKPFFGWGGWGRNEYHDPITGRIESVTDGVWIIFIGVFGWVGYIARLGLLTFPILVLARSRYRQHLGVATVGLSLVLAANLIDLIPNATLTPVTWLVGGALAGYISNGFRSRAAAASDPENDGDHHAAAAAPPQTPRHVRQPRS
ncbi:hypothetical protein [Roseovarius sp. Pro17]|uniref:O-antigen ligase family protein n=1 Tax=Roseovarius sp. Pro17 TaxID=3108175 RepID=UPI002D792DBB|nr:hypothetical protein [Roseovarius sp. Pro17]